MQLDPDYEIQRKQVWLEAWVRTAQSDSCVKLETPTIYADECLKRFDERFLTKPSGYSQRSKD